MTSLDQLLENYWFVRELDKEKYENIRRELTEKEADFIKHKLGYKLIVNPYIIKLEKVPGIPKSFMGIQEFQSKLEYLFLCLILLFLEDKSPKEQFILSGLIEFIENSSIELDLEDITIDFTLFKQRQSLVRVLKYIRSLGFIKLYDGDENKFAENVENDALYETTGVSKYFVRNFTSNITDCNLYTDIYEKEQLGLDQEKGIERKQRVYRRIFMENVIYQESDDDQDYNYIKNYKNVLERDADLLFDSSIELHKNGAYLLLSEEKNYKNIFPANKAISDIVLLINRTLREKLENKQIELTPQDTCYVTKPEWEQLIKQVRECYGKGFSKEYRVMEEEKLIAEVTKYMQEFDMVRYENEDKRFQIMPITWKIIGFYPEKFM